MTAHHLAAIHLVNLLAVVGRLDDAAALVAARTEKSQKEHDGMALHIWALTAGGVEVAAGRLSTARAALEWLPTPDRTGPTFVDVRRVFILAEAPTPDGGWVRNLSRMDRLRASAVVRAWGRRWRKCSG